MACGRLGAAWAGESASPGLSFDSPGITRLLYGRHGMRYGDGLAQSWEPTDGGQSHWSLCAPLLSWTGCPAFQLSLGVLHFRPRAAVVFSFPHLPPPPAGGPQVTARCVVVASVSAALTRLKLGLV